MKEVWESPFGHAMLKIERADKHIADFEQRLRTSSDRYGPGFYMKGNTGEKFLHYGLEDRYLRSDLALITGDAIHNLRAALDIAWVEVVRRAGRPTKYAKFPIDSTKPSMVTAKPAMRGRLKTGHVEWPKTGVVLPCRSEFGKAGFGRAVTC